MPHDTPSRQRHSTLALGGLAGMIWLIKAGTNLTPKHFFICLSEEYHMGAAHVTVKVRGA